TRDRIRAVMAYAEAANAQHTPASAEARHWFRRARTKLSAFLRNPSWTLRRAGDGDDAFALTARAIAYHRLADKTRALAEVERLVSRHPKDAYYAELKAQILLESREPARAAAAYRRAVALAPDEPLIRAGLGRALLALGTARANQEALSVLSRAAAQDHADPSLLRDLSVAYSRAGQNAMASLATAERYALLGKPRDALLHAKRARDGLPEGSGAWRRADDLARMLERRLSDR
ncbi:MAG: peptidase M48, partial [Alphaproteobacteria bacterium]